MTVEHSQSRPTTDNRRPSQTSTNLNTFPHISITLAPEPADLSSHMFIYYPHHHFSQYLDKNPHVKYLVIYNDGCGYQNKCCNLINAFAQLAVEKDVTVKQKFLVSGHNQMEHALITVLWKERLSHVTFLLLMITLWQFKWQDKVPHPIM